MPGPADLPELLEVGGFGVLRVLLAHAGEAALTLLRRIVIARLRSVPADERTCFATSYALARQLVGHAVIAHREEADVGERLADRVHESLPRRATLVPIP